MVDIDMFRMVFIPEIEKNITKDKKIQEKIIQYGFNWYKWGRKNASDEIRSKVLKLINID